MDSEGLCVLVSNNGGFIEYSCKQVGAHCTASSLSASDLEYTVASKTH